MSILCSKFFTVHHNFFSRKEEAAIYQCLGGEFPSQAMAAHEAFPQAFLPGTYAIEPEVQEESDSSEWLWLRTALQEDVANGFQIN
jgi:hypothetical protein